MDKYTEIRKSYMEPGTIYFWTATIHRWIHLLEHNHFKSIVTDSLAYLSNQRKIDVFAFVIMPNHLHIWQRDSLAIRLYDRSIMEQKLTYLHKNPLQEHWSLVTDPVNYHYSSAAFYENGCCNFPFLKSVYDEF